MIAQIAPKAVVTIAEPAAQKIQSGIAPSSIVPTDRHDDAEHDCPDEEHALTHLPSVRELPGAAYRYVHLGKCGEHLGLRCNPTAVRNHSGPKYCYDNGCRDNEREDDDPHDFPLDIPIPTNPPSAAGNVADGGGPAIIRPACRVIPKKSERRTPLPTDSDRAHADARRGGGGTRRIILMMDASILPLAREGTVPTPD